MVFNNDSAKLFSLLKNLTECCQDREILLAQKHGLSVPESRCLIAIQLENCRNTSEIAAKMRIAKSRVTRIVDGLVAKGIIERIEDKHDRRFINVTLTPEGENLTSKFISAVLNLHDMVLEKLPPKERESIIRLLEILHSAMTDVRRQIAGEQSDEVDLSS